jgi:glycosyltransferase involved in cell wall biosynthesis
MIARRLSGFLRRPAARSDDPPGTPPTIQVGFYAPANLNTMDGSAIWVESAVQTLHIDPRLRVTVLLKAAERRSIITDTIRGLERVTVVPRPADSAPLDAVGAVDRLEELDREDRFDIVIARSFEVCLEVAMRRAFGGRLWAAYVLEPERDSASPDYRAGLDRIVAHASHVLVQSSAMADLFVSIVPGVAPKLLLLPPAVPPDSRFAAQPDRPIRRLLYTGKFHPFYRIEELIDAFVELHSIDRGLSFHVVGDKVFQPPDDPDWAPGVRRRLRRTPGLVWHGALSRPDVLRLLSGGGLALSVWDYDHGPQANDLVVSTKLLDYAISGLPVILNRTIAQEALLGADYPLFVEPGTDMTTAIRRALDDVASTAAAARAARAMALRFTYPAVYAGLRAPIDAVETTPTNRDADPKVRSAEPAGSVAERANG